jgi:adenosylcobyric acid synthase
LVSKNSNDGRAPVLAVLGTGSDVGKSIVVTALCRHFASRGLRVAPYKAQNMSNNSGITPEGLEMGRAQIVQAEAAGIPPHVDMNPILLKPTSDVGSQVVLLGEVRHNATAAEYHRHKHEMLEATHAALDRLRDQYDLVVLEGAGSCAEVNLMAHDIVNFRSAEYGQAPVILVADIHRGGVFAQIVGTLECLDEPQRERIAGFIVNRFRGDIDLFRDGIDWIEKRTGRPVFGVLPWYSHFHIEEEDSVVIEAPPPVAPDSVKGPAIAVIRTPHISNFTDFDPLAALDGLHLCFVEKPMDLAPFGALILPGSKNTRADLAWLAEKGWIDPLREFHRRGGCILGICGGYQMMGRFVEDPDGLEGKPGRTAGLGLLPVETELKAPKTTTRTGFTWEGSEGNGYEIHMGQTLRRGGAPLFRVLSRNGERTVADDGCFLEGGRLMGTYIHGLFDSADITRRFLEVAGLDGITVTEKHGPAARDRDYDLLAEHLRAHVDVTAIEKRVLPGGDKRI